jgi:hypothetical protein
VRIQLLYRPLVFYCRHVRIVVADAALRRPCEGLLCACCATACWLHLVIQIHQAALILMELAFLRVVPASFSSSTSAVLESNSPTTASARCASSFVKPDSTNVVSALLEVSSCGSCDCCVTGATAVSRGLDDVAAGCEDAVMAPLPSLRRRASIVANDRACASRPPLLSLGCRVASPAGPSTHVDFARAASMEFSSAVGVFRGATPSARPVHVDGCVMQHCLNFPLHHMALGSQPWRAPM